MNKLCQAQDACWVRELPIYRLAASDAVFADEAGCIDTK